MVASQNGDVDMVKLLLENKAQVDLQDNIGWASLFAASQNGHVDVAKVLLENKAQVDLQNRPANPLCVCAYIHVWNVLPTS